MIAIDNAIGCYSIVNRGVLVDADDVLEIHIEEYMNWSICHILTPKELAKRFACTPEGDLVVLDAVQSKDFEYELFVAIAVNYVTSGLTILLYICTYRTVWEIFSNHIPLAIMDEFGKIDLSHHRWHDVGVLEMEVVVRAI